MQNNRQKKGANAFVISIVMHLVLFGLLIVSSFYHTVEIMVVVKVMVMLWAQ